MINGTQAGVRTRIAITLGDPAGIGPELGAKILADPQNHRKADIFVMADLSEVRAAASSAGVTIPIADIAGPDGVQVLDDRTAPAVTIQAAEVSEEAGKRALYQLGRALDMAKRGEIDGIVFMPLNKTSLHLAGMHEEDELRWFSNYLKYEAFTTEINAIDGLWTARVTSHVAMKDVASLITPSGVTDAIALIDRLLQEYGIARPRIGVCALNPHNGENGLFGREEIDAIVPGVKAAVSKGIDVRGPYPADTIFLSRNSYDGIVTMYHDQGQIALKVIGFDGAVTLHGGLPVVTATPAHGTAFNIVGKNLANTTSSQNALDVAMAVASRRAASHKKAGMNGTSSVKGTA
ncbi:4-hydroxythreonine-4-phosphate dehydrogenase PdxA [Lipomyces doorenjongii]